MLRLAFIFFTSSFLFACSKPFIREKDFHKLGFSSSGCFGDCPIMQGEIDNTKSFRFHGIKFTDVIGYFTGVLPDSLYEQFISKLELVKNEAKQLDKIYVDSPADVQSVRFKFILSNGKELKQDWLTNQESLENFLLDLYRKVKLTQVDTLTFVTQNFD